MKTNRILALLLAVVMLLSIFTGCNTVEPGTTDPSGSIGSADLTGTDGTDSTNGTTDTTTGTEGTTGTDDPTGTTGSDPAGNETISGTETTEPSNNPTTEPSTPTTNPGTQPSGCNHSWSNWTTKKAATCTEDGSEERICSKCGEKEQRAATTGHSYGSWSTTKSATCDTNGVKTRKCSKCSKEETQTIAATGHAWDEGKVTVTPTSCSDMGIKTYTCKTCGKTKTEQIKGNHTFGSWYYEEYTYEAYNAAGKLKTYTSHRKVRTCTKCGYKETGGTPDHRCTWGCSNHNVTTIEEATCTKGALYRSTCTVCGWYEEQRSDETGSHSNKTETRHLADYGDYTNELDATITTCTVCGQKSITYTRGEGWSDYNRYRAKLGWTKGSAYAASPVTDDWALYEHPEWQTVSRNFVYDSDGYVKQFTLYWWYNGSRYSQVIKCGEGEVEAWFAEYGLDTADNYTYTLKCYGTYFAPYKISYTG